MQKPKKGESIKRSFTDQTCVRNNNFAKALREIRLEKGFTQEAAAELLHITQAQWSAYEVGKSRPSLDMVIEISKALKINPFDLIERSLSKSKYFNHETTFTKRTSHKNGALTRTTKFPA